MTQNKNNLPMLYVLFAAAFIAAFNENIINVGLADIMAAFAIDANTANWLVTGYMIVTAIVVTVVAFLLRRFNLRTVFFGGAALFIAGSVLALVAPSFPLLLACRLLQAVGTGVFIPTMMNTVLAVAPRKRLGTFLSIGGCCITFGPAFGPVVSGLMITQFGWRSIFVVPACAMVVILVVGALLIRNIGEREPVKLDVASLIMSVVGLTALVYGLSQITAMPIAAGIALVAGIAVIALFVRRQGRIDNPLLNLAPMRNPRFSIACILVVVAMMTTFSMSVLLPLYFEGAAGADALVAGALILIPILINAGTAVLGGRVMDKRGEWPLLPGGFLLIAVGLTAVCLTAGSINLVWVVAASCIVYAGVGFIFSPSQTAGLRTLPPEQNPHGVGIMSTFIQISAAIGPSLFVGVLSSTLADRLAGGSSEAAANADGFSAAVAVAAVIACAGLVVAFAYARKAVAAERAAGAGAPSKAEAAGARQQNGQAGVGSDGMASQPLSIERIMKTDAYTVPADAPVYAAVEAMLAHRTSGLPVVDGRGNVVGFVSDGDIMKALGDVGGDLPNLYYSLTQLANAQSFDQRLDELMRSDVMDLATRHVVSATTDMPLERVCAILSERRIKKLPVLDDRKLVGTVSRSDVNRYLMGSFIENGKPAEARA